MGVLPMASNVISVAPDKCRSCWRTLRENPQRGAYDETRKEEILRAYHERTSLRGLQRIFGVSRQTVAVWLKKVSAPACLEHDAGARSGG